MEDPTGSNDLNTTSLRAVSSATSLEEVAVRYAFHELDALVKETMVELVRDHPMGYVPQIIWKNLRVTAGLAHYRERTITLSRTLLTTPERLLLTLKHEYAHLLAVARYGQKGAGHSAGWREAMIELGLEPKIYHRYPTQRNQPRQEVAYKCARCPAILIRKRRLPKGKLFVHAGCGGRLSLLYVKPKTPTLVDA